MLDSYNDVEYILLYAEPGHCSRGSYAEGNLAFPYRPSVSPKLMAFLRYLPVYELIIF